MGQGEVWLAHDNSDNSYVAIKQFFMTARQGQEKVNPDNIAQKEGQALQKVTHENVANVVQFGIGKYTGQLYEGKGKQVDDQWSYMASELCQIKSKSHGPEHT